SASRDWAASTGWTARTTNGNVTNATAAHTPQKVCCSSRPTGLDGPYRASSTIEATMVGSANGRSMAVSITRLPGKSSRTSTQAITVPITALTPVTASATARVTPSADSAAGAVTASTNPPGPPAKAVATIAA